jgi:hypothetical protein
MKLNSNAEGLKCLFRHEAFEATIPGSYPGEYLDNARVMIKDINDIIQIAYVLAQKVNLLKWKESSIDIFNSDQKKRTIIWLGNNQDSPIIKAALYCLYKTEQESVDPVEKPEVCVRHATSLYLDLKAKLAEKKVEPEEFIVVLELIPDLASVCNGVIREYISRLDPYKEWESIEGLLKASMDSGWNLKNNLVTNMKKLITNNVTNNTKPFEVLSELYTERQIRYLNCVLINASNITIDNVEIAFMDSIINKNETPKITEEETKLIKQLARSSFYRKHDECRDYFEYFISKGLTYKEDLLKSAHDWKVFYEAFILENPHNNYLVQHKSIFSFDIVSKSEREKWNFLRENDKWSLLYSECTTKSNDEEWAKGAYALICETWQNEKDSNAVFEYLIEKEKYSLITYFVKMGLIERPKVITHWVKGFRGTYDSFTIPYFLELYELGNDMTWLFDRMYRNEGFVDCILTITKVFPGDVIVGQKWLNFILDILFQYEPNKWLVYLEQLFEQTEHTVNLEECFGKEIIQKIAQSLLKYCSYNSFDLNKAILKYAVSKEEYEALQKQHDLEKESHEELKALQNIQKRIKELLENYLDRNFVIESYNDYSLRSAFREPIIKDVMTNVFSKMNRETLIEKKNFINYVTSMNNLCDLIKDDELSVESLCIEMAQNILIVKGEII